MDKAYVSEFSEFMDRYLGEHPEVVEDQRRGWEFFWEAKVGLMTPEISKDDVATDDSYGFSWHTWHADMPGVKKPAGSGKAE
jgi:hypothetical protein